MVKILPKIWRSEDAVATAPSGYRYAGESRPLSPSLASSDARERLLLFDISQIRNGRAPAREVTEVKTVNRRSPSSDIRFRMVPYGFCEFSGMHLTSL